MSVMKRKGSPFYCYEFVFRGRRFRGSTKLTNLVAARRFESNFVEKLARQRGGIVDPVEVPFFYLFAAAFLEDERHRLRPATLRGYFSALANLERFHRKHLDEICATEIQQFIAARLEERKSPSTVNRDLAFLRRVLQVAVSRDVLDITPFSQRKVRLLKERKRERVLTFGEEHRYLSRATEPLADLAVLMLELALWPGEAFRIRAEDVYLRSHLHVAGTKTEGSDRDVPITARARRILEARLAARKSEHLFPLRVGNGFDQADDQRERRAPRG